MMKHLWYSISRRFLFWCLLIGAFIFFVPVLFLLNLKNESQKLDGYFEIFEIHRFIEIDHYDRTEEERERGFLYKNRWYGFEVNTKKECTDVMKISSDHPTLNFTDAGPPSFTFSVGETNRYFMSIFFISQAKYDRIAEEPYSQKPFLLFSRKKNQFFAYSPTPVYPEDLQKAQSCPIEIKGKYFPHTKCTFYDGTTDEEKAFYKLGKDPRVSLGIRCQKVE